MKLITRSAWHARAPRSATHIGGTKGVKVHYTGGYENPAMARDHDLCFARVRAIQNGHMDPEPDGNGWWDIGYTALACVHGYVFAGRGPGVLPAANGPGLNSGHYAVCGLIGSEGLVEPTPKLLDAIRDAIDWLRRTGNAGPQIKGHRDGYDTDCPGPRLYAWVHKGAPRPDDEEDDVPDYVSVGATGTAQDLKPGAWTTVRFDHDYSDRNHQHADEGGPSILNGPARYSLMAGMVVTGLPEGTEVEIRAIEINSSGRIDACPDARFYAGKTDTKALYNLAADTLPEGRRLRVQVRHAGAETAKLAGATAKVHYWR